MNKLIIEKHLYSYRLICNYKGYEFNSHFNSEIRLEQWLEGKVTKLKSQGFDVEVKEIISPYYKLQEDGSDKAPVKLYDMRNSRKNKLPQWFIDGKTVYLNKEEIQEKMADLLFNNNKFTVSSNKISSKIFNYANNISDYYLAISIFS